MFFRRVKNFRTGMEVNGKHEFEVSIEDLWGYLMDADVLAKITPGISKLEALGGDKYKSISVIKLGPVKGDFTGDLEVIDKVEPNSFSIKMKQESRIGNAHVNVDMKLKALPDDKVELEFDGKANLSGIIARTGQRVLSGVANVITKEVFASLEKHIQEQKNANN